MDGAHALRTADWSTRRESFLVGAPPSAAQAVSEWYAVLESSALFFATKPVRAATNLCPSTQNAHYAILRVAGIKTEEGAASGTVVHDDTTPDAPSSAPIGSVMGTAAAAGGQPVQPPAEGERTVAD